MGKTIVVIHGVGPSAPSVVGHELANTLGLEITQQTTVCVKSETFIEFLDTRSNNSIVEVNWADLAMPEKTAPSILSHFWYFISSMVDVAILLNPLARSPITRIYRALLLAISPGAIYYLVSSAIVVSVTEPYQRRSFLAISIIALIGFMFWAKKMGTYFYWLIGYIILLSILFFNCWDTTLPLSSPLVSLADQLRYVTFGGVTLFLALSVLENWFTMSRIETRITHAALRFIPFIVMNMFVSWLFFLGLGFIKNNADKTKYDGWERYVTPQFDYALLEKITTYVIGGIGVAGILLPLSGFFFKWTNSSQPEINKKGRGSQNGFLIFLGFTAIALLILAFISGYISRNTQNHDEYLFKIYEVSIWRTLPFLGWTLGSFRIILDIIGDVLYYLEPNKTYPSAIADKCENRLKEAIFYAEQKPNQEVIVLAHSQGSVIAAKLRAQGILNGQLITIGSPVGSLYERFLDIHQEGNKENWLNLYREGDFVAGPIQGVDNKDLQVKGTHINYWTDKILADYLKF